MIFVLIGLIVMIALPLLIINAPSGPRMVPKQQQREGLARMRERQERLRNLR